MNKTIVLTIAVVSLACFFAGAWVGRELSEATVSTNYLRDNFVQTSVFYHVLNQLEKGDIEGAKAGMHLYVDSGIIAIDRLAPLADEDAKKFGCNFLKMAAKWRKGRDSWVYPAVVSDPTAVQREVFAILDDADSCGARR